MSTTVVSTSVETLANPTVKSLFNFAPAVAAARIGADNNANFSPNADIDLPVSFILFAVLSCCERCSSIFFVAFCITPVKLSFKRKTASIICIYFTYHIKKEHIVNKYYMLFWYI